MIGLTERLARFAHDPGFSEAPESAERIIRSGVIDTVGTMIAGRNEPVVRIVRQHVAHRRSNARESSVLLGVGACVRAGRCLDQRHRGTRP